MSGDFDIEKLFWGARGTLARVTWELEEEYSRKKNIRE